MIRFLPHPEIDKERWDQCIDFAPNGLIFGKSCFLDAAFPGWGALVMDDYDAVLVIPLKKKLGISYAYNPLFIRQLGIYSKHILNPDDESRFLSLLEKKANATRIFMHPLTTRTVPGKITEKLHQELPMKGYAFNSNAGRNVRKALKEGCAVTVLEDPSIVADMFAENKGGTLEIFSEADYLRLKNIMQAAAGNGCGKAFGVSGRDGKLLGSGFFCFHNRTITYLKGAATEEGKKTGAMHLLFAHVLELYGPDYDRMDFGGSNVPSVARFYHGFGASDKPYIFYESGQLLRVATLLKRKK